MRGGVGRGLLQSSGMPGRDCLMLCSACACTHHAGGSGEGAAAERWRDAARKRLPHALFGVHVHPSCRTVGGVCLSGVCVSPAAVLVAAVQQLRQQLEQLGSGLIVRMGPLAMQVSGWLAIPLTPHPPAPHPPAHAPPCTSPPYTPPPCTCTPLHRTLLHRTPLHLHPPAPHPPAPAPSCTAPPCTPLHGTPASHPLGPPTILPAPPDTPWPIPMPNCSPQSTHLFFALIALVSVGEQRCSYGVGHHTYFGARSRGKVECVSAWRGMGTSVTTWRGMGSKCDRMAWNW